MNKRQVDVIKQYSYLNGKITLTGWNTFEDLSKLLIRKFKLADSVIELNKTGEIGDYKFQLVKPCSLGLVNKLDETDNVTLTDWFISQKLLNLNSKDEILDILKVSLLSLCGKLIHRRQKSNNENDLLLGIPNIISEEQLSEVYSEIEDIDYINDEPEYSVDAFKYEFLKNTEKYKLEEALRDTNKYTFACNKEDIGKYRISTEIVLDIRKEYLTDDVEASAYIFEREFEDVFKIKSDIIDIDIPIYFGTIRLDKVIDMLLGVVFLAVELSNSGAKNKEMDLF